MPVQRGIRQRADVQEECAADAGVALTSADSHCQRPLVADTT